MYCELKCRFQEDSLAWLLNNDNLIMKMFEEELLCIILSSSILDVAKKVDNSMGKEIKNYGTSFDGTVVDPPPTPIQLFSVCWRFMMYLPCTIWV